MKIIPAVSDMWSVLYMILALRCSLAQSPPPDLSLANSLNLSETTTTIQTSTIDAIIPRNASLLPSILSPNVTFQPTGTPSVTENVNSSNSRPIGFIRRVLEARVRHRIPLVILNEPIPAFPNPIYEIDWMIA